MPQDENFTIDQQEARSDNPNWDRETRGDAREVKDIPVGSGQIADEDVSALDGGVNAKGGPTGQDHSTENYGDSIPDHGVGAVQDNSDTTSDVARIQDRE